MTELNLSGLYGIPKSNNISLNFGPEYQYDPLPSNSVKLNLSGSYTPPSNSNIKLYFGGFSEPATPTGYTPTSNINLTNKAYTPTFNINIGETTGPVTPEIPTPTVIPNQFKTGWGIANTIDVSFLSAYEIARPVNKEFRLLSEAATPIDNVILLRQKATLKPIDKTWSLKRKDTFNKINKSYNSIIERLLKPIDKTHGIGFKKQFKELAKPFEAPYTIPPTKDTIYASTWNSVRIYGVERVPIYSEVEIGYTPTFNLNLNQTAYIPNSNLNLKQLMQSDETYEPYETPDNKNISLNFNGEYLIPNSGEIALYMGKLKDTTDQEQELIGYEKTPIQPTGTEFKAQFSPAKNIIDFSKSLQWGYGLNNFVIGGAWRDIYDQEEPEPPEPPGEPINHKNYGVYRVVNIVNIRAMPGGEILHFDNFTMTRDLESFAWTFNFNLLDRASYNLVKPAGRTLKSIEVEINGIKFGGFIGKSTTSRSAGSDGVVKETYKTTGWSTLKLLSNPYSRKRAYSESQQKTAAQIVTAELTGTGFILDWQTVDWNIPAGVHNYQDKTPLGAILSVVNSVGGVIIPDNLTDKLTVKPYYPVSPWNWYDAEIMPDRTMSENQFFTIDNEAVPVENPDGVFVYGEEKGVGVQAVRQGKPGTALLPDIVDKYITQNAAGQERGRIEVARNSYIEKVPMTTYVDENGIIMPQDLIEFTTQEGDKWRGMVSQVSIACQRVGTALAQQIIVDRFYDE